MLQCTRKGIFTVTPKNQISSEKFRITLAKIKISIPNFFPELLGPKQIEAIHFRNGFHYKSAQNDCSNIERAQTSEHCFIEIFN